MEQNEMTYERIREDVFGCIDKLFSRYNYGYAYSDVEECIDQILKIKGIRREAEKQDLPKTQMYTLRTDIIKARDKEIKMAGFVKCLKDNELGDR